MPKEKKDDKKKIKNIGKNPSYAIEMEGKKAKVSLEIDSDESQISVKVNSEDSGLTVTEFLDQVNSKGEQILVQPIVLIPTKDGVKKIMIDCSGCNNNDTVIDSAFIKRHGFNLKEKNK